jgi:hypothetical protein
MIEQDTIKLLRECDAGIKMGISSIEEVIDHVKNEDFRHNLSRCKEEHEALQAEITQALDRFGDEGKDPNPIAKGMSWMKTNMKLGLEDTDATVADLMTDGCNMGVKSLSRYLNQYKAAGENAKDVAKRLIKLEAQLAENIRPYL